MARPIEVATLLHVAVAQAREVLLDHPGPVFSEAFTIDDQHRPRLSTELSVDLGAGASVHQEVMLQLGVTRCTETGVVVPVAWQAAGRERLFPTFDGELHAFEADTGTRLRLSGTYSVPFGGIGRIGNGVLGWRLAHRSLEDLLRRLADRIEAEAKRRLESVRRRSVPRPSSPPDWERSEMYIG
jgi:hypothetical protein